MTKRIRRNNNNTVVIAKSNSDRKEANMSAAMSTEAGQPEMADSAPKPPTSKRGSRLQT